jgi:hypothetical protein
MDPVYVGYGLLVPLMYMYMRMIEPYSKYTISNLSNRVESLENDISELKKVKLDIRSTHIPDTPDNHDVCKEDICMARKYHGSKMNCQCPNESNGLGLCMRHLKQYNKPGNKKLRDGWWGVMGPESNNYNSYSVGHEIWSKRQYFWKGDTIIDNRPEYVRKEYPLE